MHNVTALHLCHCACKDTDQCMDYVFGGVLRNGEFKFGGLIRDHHICIYAKVIMDNIQLHVGPNCFDY